MIDFWLELATKGSHAIAAQIHVDDMKQNWGDIVWIEIPKPFANDFPEITGVRVRHMRMFDSRAKQVRIPVTTDLIKK